MTQTQANTHRVAVLADSETATGYRLAGVEVIVATSENAARELETLVTSNRYGLVAVDTSLLSDPQQAVSRAMRGRDLPIILPVPSLRDAFSTETVDAKAYMGKLVRDTIGFDIKL
ncbi:V-type ATP synthase subunit F [Deinococcus peraridilitoris]|uniref:Archaeal/vacuolar-type H+-ATPase subunit F n=1 Tax=Deinococcus peraridilitoris (strain DSM 19664 / LMG 22246 / CIP 109416 / KR-200) TaxID=937777 RepID=L0A479_DEIPD|nr:V-type ATP synthase subunit F [Deinococcus peraridilitoris]AFZ67835.1 archaeal/vacuolar-type H+-ATPase subunit F [Deinococcus peraridilitoris DSM 19664]